VVFGHYSGLMSGNEQMDIKQPHGAFLMSVYWMLIPCSTFFTRSWEGGLYWVVHGTPFNQFNIIGPGNVSVENQPHWPSWRRAGCWCWDSCPLIAFHVLFPSIEHSIKILVQWKIYIFLATSQWCLMLRGCSLYLIWSSFDSLLALPHPFLASLFER